MGSFVLPPTRARLAALVLLAAIEVSSADIADTYRGAIEAAQTELAQTMALQEQLRAQIEQGRFDAAEATAARIEERRTALEARCAETWRVQREIDALKDSDDYDELEKLLKARRPVFGCESPPEPSDYASTLEDIARQRSAASKDVAAADRTEGERDALFVEPLSLWGFDAAAHPQSSRSERLLLQQAYMELGAGRAQQAQTLLEQALRADNDQTPCTEIFAMLAMTAQQTGQLARANSRLFEGIARVERFDGPNSRLLAPLLQRQALLLATMGQHSSAIEVATRAHALYASATNTVEFGFSLHNLGVIYHVSGELAQAKTAYDESFSSIEHTLQGTDAMTATLGAWHRPTMLSNAGLLAWQQGDLQRALAHFMDAQSLLSRDAELHLSEASELKRAQNLLVELDAMLSLERAMHTAPRPDAALSMLLERKGAVLQRRSLALQDMQRDATTAGSAIGNTQGQPFAHGQWLEAVQSGRFPQPGGASAGLLAAYQTALAARAALNATAAGSAEERAARQQHADALDVRIRAMEQSIGMNASLQDAMRASASSPRIELQALAEAVEEGRTDEFVAAQMARMRAEREAVLAQGSVDRARQAADISARLPAGAVLLEMVQYRPMSPDVSLPAVRRFGPARYGTYVIRAGADPDYVDLGDAAHIDALIAQFRAALVDPGASNTTDIGRQLDALLMAPVRERTGTVPWIFIAPAGTLSLVPFAALVDEQQRYLIESTRFGWLTSGRELLREQRRETARSPMLIVANPDFDAGPNANDIGHADQAGAPHVSPPGSRRTLQFAPLPATASEGAAVQQIWRDARLLAGAAATERALKDVHGPRLLHIASHGFFLPHQPDTRGAPTKSLENPLLRSGIALASANRMPAENDGEDGLLTALEASTLDLVGTQLVVLSACDTGVGNVTNGEGVFGLRRAFVLAGAESLVMTLWSVDDAVTAEIMRRYHERLAQGEGRADAMHRAQLDLLRDAQTHEPYYWASFIVAGMWGPL